MPIRMYIQGKGVVAEFPDGTPEVVIDMAVQRDFFGKAPERPFKEKALDFITMGHMYPEPISERPEISFTPEGKVKQWADVPTAEKGFFEDPITALSMGAVAGARAAAGPVGKVLTAARESLGWFTGGTSEVPALAKAGAKGVAKAIEVKPLAKAAEGRQAKGVFESITPEAKISTEAANAAQQAPKTTGIVQKILETEEGTPKHRWE